MDNCFQNIVMRQLPIIEIWFFVIQLTGGETENLARLQVHAATSVHTWQLNMGAAKKINSRAPHVELFDFPFKPRWMFNTRIGND